MQITTGNTCPLTRNGVVLMEIEDAADVENLPEHAPSKVSPVPVFPSLEILTVEDLNLEEEEILKRTKQGLNRTTKLKSLESLELNCARPGQEKRKRGRKPKSIAGPSILREITEGSRGIDPNFIELQASTTTSGSGA